MGFNWFGDDGNGGIELLLESILIHNGVDPTIAYEWIVSLSHKDASELKRMVWRDITRCDNSDDMLSVWSKYSGLLDDDFVITVFWGSDEVAIVEFINLLNC